MSKERPAAGAIQSSSLVVHVWNGVESGEEYDNLKTQVVPDVHGDDRRQRLRGALQERLRRGSYGAQELGYAAPPGLGQPAPDPTYRNQRRQETHAEDSPEQTRPRAESGER